MGTLATSGFRASGLGLRTFGFKGLGLILGLQGLRLTLGL